MHADGKERSQNDLLNNFNTPPLPQKKVLMRNRENKQMRKR